MKRGFNKRGVGSHFEMVVAFVLFFTFVVFLLVFIKPYQTGTLSASVIAGLHDSFVKQSETEYTKFFLQVEENVGDCVNVELDGRLFRFELTDSIAESEGIGVDSQIESGGSLKIADDKTAHYVLVSPVFSDDVVSCSDVDEDGYKLGSIDEKNVIAYLELLALKDQYEDDYDNLKKELDFPEAYDFSIVSDLITMEGVVPQEGDIVAEDFVEEVLFSNGTIINQKFTLKVW